MKKLLFIAGEPGSGKSEYIAGPLDTGGFGFVISTDKVSYRASKYYERHKSLGCIWQLWKHEFDRSDNQLKIEHALRLSMEELFGSNIDHHCNVIVEGVLSGHPRFRETMLSILPKFGFYPDDILTLAICVSRGQLHHNLRTRGRRKDQRPVFVEMRSIEYRQRLRDQPEIRHFDTTDACYQAASEFLASTASNTTA